MCKPKKYCSKTDARGVGMAPDTDQELIMKIGRISDAYARDLKAVVQLMRELNDRVTYGQRTESQELQTDKR